MFTRDELVEFSKKQRELIERYQSLYSASESSLGLGAPRHGELAVDGRVWLFRRHGVGVSFVEPSTGVVVDAHRLYEKIQSPIDAWRIVQYLESVSGLALGEREIGEILRAFALKGELVETEHPGVYVVRSEGGPGT